jgi:1,2-phenylacetyl-CoA epoxidase PaaB subunit
MPAIDISQYVVTKEEFDRRVAEVWVQSEDHVITATSDEETSTIEKLLDITAGELGPTQLKRPKGGEACSNCGRQ